MERAVEIRLFYLLGVPPAISGSFDCNDVPYGFYTAATNKPAQEMQNGPAAITTGIVLLISFRIKVENRITQYVFNGSHIYYRDKYSEWTNWATVL